MTHMNITEKNELKSRRMQIMKDVEGLMRELDKVNMLLRRDTADACGIHNARYDIYTDEREISDIIMRIHQIAVRDHYEKMES